MTSWNPFFAGTANLSLTTTISCNTIPSHLPLTQQLQLWHDAPLLAGNSPSFQGAPSGSGCTDLPRFASVSPRQRCQGPDWTCMYPSVLMIQNADLHRSINISMILSTLMIWTLDISNDMAYMSVLSWMVVVAPPPLRGVLCRTRDLSKWILHPRKFGTFQWHVLNVLGQNLEFQLLNSNSLSPWHAICKIQPHLGFSEQNNGESPTIDGSKPYFPHYIKWL